MATNHASVTKLLPQLNKLASIDPAAMARIARAADRELIALKATAVTLSQTERDMCGHTGVNPDDLAAFQAKQAADARIVAGIPHDQLVIMRVLYGDDNSVLATRYTELQEQIADGKVARA